MITGEPLPAGHLLDGRYRINKVLGVGGMGRVYLSNDTRLANRPVAVKEMIVGEGLQEKKAVEDFSREARVLAMLSHIGIPNVIDYFVEKSRHYLVMEYVAGGDLQHWLDKLGPGGRVAEDRVLRWSRQILDVLDFLHHQNPPIVYRDLKPGNIMIDKNGRAMLIDFGIARFLPPGGRGTQIGSVGYAPPEQYLGKMEPRSDLYSLAATMHHLLSARDPQLEPPFSFPPLRNLAPDVSAQTADVVMRALDKDATKRPASARDMSRQLPEPGPDTGADLAPVSTSSAEFHQPSVAAPAMPSGFSSMRTLVLSKPASLSPATSPPDANSSHLATGARSGAAALGAILRSLVQPPPIPEPDDAPARAGAVRVSATAKTKDLRRKPPAAKAAASGASARRSPAIAAGGSKSDAAPGTSHTARRNPPPSALNGSSLSEGAVANRAVSSQVEGGAKLVAKFDSTQFSLPSSSAIIGRVLDPSDAVDVDLSKLKSGADRVSRRHAEIIRRGSDYFIRDLGSTNGTFIIGRGRLGRDQLYKLKDRDNVVFGGATFEFRKG